MATMDEFRRRERASRIQEPGDNREWLRSLVRNFDVRAPQRPDDVHPHASYLYQVAALLSTFQFDGGHLPMPCVDIPRTVDEPLKTPCAI